MQVGLTRQRALEARPRSYRREEEAEWTIKLKFTVARLYAPGGTKGRWWGDAGTPIWEVSSLRIRGQNVKKRHWIGIGAVVFVAGFAAVMAAINVDRMMGRGGKAEPEIVMLGGTSPTVLAQGGVPAGLDFRASAKKMLKSLASIETVTAGEDIFGRRFTRPGGSGSGVIVSDDGYIVTNNHVVTDRGREVDRVLVTVGDDTVNAKIVGRDPRSDLAVLKIDKTGLTPIEFGDSDALDIGEWVIAAGNPLGYTNTISVGIVSSKGRQLPTEDSVVFVDGIQTDAAINMGNSGGPLGDSSGRLVGINVAIASLDGGSLGIGFAIPVNRMREAVKEIIDHGHVRYGDIGLVVEQQSSAILSIERFRDQLKRLSNSSSEPPQTGIVVANIYRNSAAEQAGLKRYDVVTKINGKVMNELIDYQSFIADKKPGDKLILDVWSAGKTKQVTVVLREAGSLEESF